MIKKLTEEDLIILLEKRKQIIVTYSIILFVAMIPYTALYLILKHVIFNPSNHFLPTSIFTILVFTIFGFVFWKSFRKPHMDIICGSKTVLTQILNKKIATTKYSSTGHFVVDLTVQPILKEHYFIVNEETYFVEEDIYNNYEEGMEIVLHFSKHTNTLLRIEDSEL